MIKNNVKELIFNFKNKTIRYEVEITKRVKENEEIHLRVLNINKALQVKTLLKVEIRITQSNEFYSFNSVVLGFKDNIVIIKEPEKVNKIQRRANKRYNYKSDVEIIKSENNSLGESFNLSKSGLGFRSKDLFFIDEILFINLKCPAQKKYTLEVTVKDQFVEENGMIRYGVQFAEWVGNEFDYLLRFLENREKNIAIRKTKKEDAALKIDSGQKNRKQKIKLRNKINKLNFFQNNSNETFPLKMR